jgi:hypothetical protein
MKSIEENELYEHLSGFLKAKGIELKEGSYAKRIQQGCTLLSDAINLSQKGLERAKTEAEKKLDQMRQVIHEKTAPKAPASSPSARKPSAGPKKTAARSAAPSTPAKQKRQTGRPRSARK